MNITRRNVLGSLALSAVPATALAVDASKTGHISLEERLAAMSRDELEDYYMDCLIEVLEYNTSGLYRSKRLTPGGYTQVILNDRRGALGTDW